MAALKECQTHGCTTRTKTEKKSFASRLKLYIFFSYFSSWYVQKYQYLENYFKKLSSLKILLVGILIALTVSEMSGLTATMYGKE